MGAPWSLGQTYVPQFAQSQGGGGSHSQPQSGGPSFMSPQRFNGPSSPVAPLNAGQNLQGALPGAQYSGNNLPMMFPQPQNGMDYSSYQIPGQYLSNQYVSGVAGYGGGKQYLNMPKGTFFNEANPQTNSYMGNFGDMQGQWQNYFNNLYGYQSQYGDQGQSFQSNHPAPSAYSQPYYNSYANDLSRMTNPQNLIDQAKSAYSDMYNHYTQAGAFGIPN